MIIPEEVEKKIRYLQNIYPSTEWSGVLFFKYTGSFEDNLAITCVDIYPMDLGNSTFTEFNMNEEVTSYVAEHMDTLWDCEMGLVHSHHNMSTFFSSTDTDTLREEGNARNTFVSLIVNNEGTYSAAVTRKVIREEDITFIESYTLFGNSLSSQPQKSTRKEVTEIQYFMLDIDKADVPNPFKYIDQRFIEIKKRKERNNSLSWGYPLERNRLYPEPVKHIKQQELWPEVGTMIKPKPSKGTSLDPTVIHDCVVRMLLCSLIVNTGKINIKAWIMNNMYPLYSKTFGTVYDERFVSYKDWAVDYFLLNYEDPILKDRRDLSNVESEIAQAMIEELESYKASNVYIDSFIRTLEHYIELDNYGE